MSKDISPHFPAKIEDFALRERKALAQKLAPWKDSFLDMIHNHSLPHDLMHLMYSFLLVIEANGDKYSSVGRLAKIQESLAELHNKEEEKTVTQTERLMLPTLGSQV